MSKLGHAGHPTDRLVRRFAALAEGVGRSPDVATFLADYPKASIRERADVMLIDLARRVSSDEAVGVEEYLSADAEVAADDEVTLELIVAEHDFRTRLGNKPEISDFASRFPARADSIRSVLSQRTDEDRLPPYPQMIRQMFELRLTPATAWGTLLGATTGFSGSCPPFN